MAILVVDCSVTMSWLFSEEFTPFSERVLDEVIEGQALEPAIWPLEVANVMLMAERRGRISQAESSQFLALLSGLEIDVSTPAERDLFDDLLPLARETGITAYDAGYLELAGRLGVPLATLDRRLENAAVQVGVAVFS
jgi:predicted nucleic acid-binding protein